MNTDIDQLDDPSLKKALKRVYGHESAPPALRQRIQDIFSDPQAGVLQRNRSWWQQPVFRFAAAALFVVAVGSLALWFNRPVNAGTMDLALIAAMVSTHDHCCDQDHRDKQIPQDDRQTAGRALESKVHAPVLMANLIDEGWIFKGAAVCPVNGKSSAHLVFSRGGQRLSVFSLPVSACTQKPTCRLYKENRGGHVIAGIVKDNGLYCMIAHCPKHGIDINEVCSLLERHQEDLVAALPLSVEVAHQD
jgi:hypothetical protein